MANLKGSTFEKQSKDLFHRLESFSVSRHGKDDHQTHSDKVAEKREMYTRDIISYFQENEIEGKLNQLLTQDNINNFFNERFENLSIKTQEDYIRGFSSMLKGLEEKNISIPITYDYFDNRVKELKQDQPDKIIENRYIENVHSVIDNLYIDRYTSGLIADIQNELGIRVSESFELASNPDKYIDNGIVGNLVGKGNHIYEQKDISLQLTQKILNNQEPLPDKTTYYRDLQKYNISSHDFRFTYARDKYQELTNNGVSQEEAKKEVSQNLNHARLSISDYYLART